MTNPKNFATMGNIKVGGAIWLLTFADMFTWGGATLLSSLTGLYISLKLGHDAFFVIGTTITIFFLTRSIFQLPIGILLDKIKKDTDEIVALVIGVFLMGLPFTLYPLATEVHHFYTLHFVYGLGTSLNLNAWRKLFAKNLEKGREGMSYGVYETVMSLGAAGFSYAGGLVANWLDVEQFGDVIVGIGVLIMLAGVWGILLLRIENRKSSR